MGTDSPEQFEADIGRRIMRGDLAGAATAAATCREAWPTATTGWFFGSVIALLNGQTKAALDFIEWPLQGDPGNAQLLLQKAECLLALRQRDHALAAARSAAERQDDNPAGLDALAEFFLHAEDYGRALEIFDRAVAATPSQPMLVTKRADLHRLLGNLELAERDYLRALELQPATYKALAAAVEMRRQSPEHNRLTALHAALGAVPPDSSDAALLSFALAKAHQDLGQYPMSWQHLAAGNAIERRRIQYEPATDRAVVNAMIAGFPDAGNPQAGTSDAAPIFIVGMPRTGSTLIEQIISGHSLVQSRGESPALPAALDAALDRSGGRNFSDRANFINALYRLDGQLIAQEYLALMRAGGAAGGRFTDKLLENFLYCPLILRAFPRARIINVTRHPVATCFAIFRTRFNGTNTFAYDLAEIAEFYIGYRRIMAHWHSILPGRILDVAYEDLVTELEPTTRALLEWLELPFEPQVLQFDRNTAPVRTASVTQVRRPLYDTSLNMWRHYSGQLSALTRRLRSAGLQAD